MRFSIKIIVGSNGFNEASDGYIKNSHFDLRKKALKKVRKFKKKYKKRDPIENNILKYFDAQANLEVLDYDDLQEKGLIFDKSESPEREPRNTHDLRIRPIKKVKADKRDEFYHKRPYHKRKENKNTVKENEINLLKIHIENRKSASNPRILDENEPKPLKSEEMKEEEEIKPLPTQPEKKEDENEQKNSQIPKNPNYFKENFDYDKLFFIPKFQKMIDQNYSTLSTTDKAYYQNLFYNRLMQFNNSMDYFNPYYSNPYFGMPDCKIIFNNF